MASTSWDSVLESYLNVNETFPRRDTEPRRGDRKARWVSEGDPAADDHSRCELLYDVDGLRRFGAKSVGLTVTKRLSVILDGSGESQYGVGFDR